MTNKETLVSRQVSIRRDKEKKLKQQHKEVMGNHLTNRKPNEFAQSTSATSDKYMVDALSKARESKVSIPETLSRQNGTWMYNRSFNK